MGSKKKKAKKTGRIKGRVYADMVVRGLRKSRQRMAHTLDRIAKYNKTAKSYGETPVPNSLVKKLIAGHQATGLVIDKLSE